MGYHVIDPDDLDARPDRPSEMRYISEAADLDHLGLRLYRVDPGESIPLSGLHYHDEQEEAFYVVAGTLSVETPDELFRVPAGHVFIAEPGSAHRAHVDADADGPAEVVGIGAPPQSDGHAYED
jgi:quercetin dioxygenase-like cupin family protein